MTHSGPKLPAARPGRPGGRRDTNRRERTKAITDAALALFLARGIEAVTIEDITSAADVAKGSFYRYFDDKAALVQCLFSDVSAHIVGFIDASLAAMRSAPSKEAAIASYAIIAVGVEELLVDFRGPVLLYLQENRGAADGARAPVRQLADLVRDKALERTRHALERGLLKPFPAEVSVLAVIGAVERLVFGALAGEVVAGVWDPGTLTRLLLDGLRAPEASSAQQ